MINWKVRAKNKAFWVALIPAALLLAQCVAAVFGASVDLSALGDKLLSVVNALFAVLAILGVVTDPTTAGISDSDRAQEYIAPGVPAAELESDRYFEPEDLEDKEYMEVSEHEV